jgi:hypothetical protein
MILLLHETNINYLTIIISNNSLVRIKYELNNFI